MTAVEQVKVEQSIAEEGRLLYEQGDLRIEVVELTRLAAIKADEREQKARDFMRAEMRYHRAVEDLKTKQLQIQDHEKKFKGQNMSAVSDLSPQTTPASSVSSSQWSICQFISMIHQWVLNGPSIHG